MTSLIDTSIEMKILDTNSDISKDNSKINFAYLHVTNNCNFNCIGCYSKDEYRNSCTDLSLEQITKILDELKNNELDSLVISGGEPFLRNDLQQIVKYAKEIGIDKVIIATNGNVYPCHMLHYKEFKLGNLLENSLQSILSSEVVSKFLSTTIVDEVRECSECSYKYFCGGGCKARRYFVNGEVSSKDCYCDAYLFNYKKFGDYISTFSNDGKNS